MAIGKCERGALLVGRPVVLGNNHMLVGLNEHGLVHDFYFPYVGQENLTTARSIHHLLGVWVDDKFSWLDDGSWEIIPNFESDALVGKTVALNSNMQIKIVFSDFVDYEYTAFCRRIEITNQSDSQKEVRLFMHQVFEISRHGRSDTAIYVPEGNYIYDYKGRCALLISAVNSQGESFDQFAIGNYGIEGKAGTYKDAEDGNLEGNLVEHGSVDTVIRQRVLIDSNSSTTVDYWVVASFSQLDAESIHNELKRQGLHTRLDLTRQYWRDWLSIASPSINKIDDEHKDIFKKSLMLIKAHTDRRGGIIASGDSSIYNYGRDYYNYVWPRDGGLTMLTLIELGYQEEPKKFFEFCIDTINPDGYMMHKYQPDRSIGSTWHPLMHRHHPELAIQEDETAVVVYAMAKYFKKFDDEKFLNHAYHNLIVPAANFMSSFIDVETGLPHPSYDLWEERFGTHTYTVVLTVAALIEAAKIAQKLEHNEIAQTWHSAAVKIQNSLDKLYSKEVNSFRKSLLVNQDGTVDYNDTLDMSTLYSFVEFFPDTIADERIKNTAQTAIAKLLDSSPSGGAVRYEHDNYFLVDKTYLGNPWMICTLWVARYEVLNGNKQKAKELINWVISKGSSSGVLAEQVDPVNGYQIGVSPLVWSHAEIVNTLIELTKDQ